MLIKTQVMGTTMVNPLDISDVTDERDRKRLERIDYLFCSLSDDLPLIIKHKVRSILNSHYLVRYDWDDNVYILPLRKLMERLNVEYVRDIGVCKQGLLIHVWKTEELERQDLAPLRKKARYDPPSNGAGDGGVASGGGSGSGSSVHGAD